MSLVLLSHYFSSRWHAKVKLSRLFWCDMLLVGTLLNLFASFAALMLMALSKEPAWALALHFSTLPYNLFLLASVWRFPTATPAARFSACAWFGVMVVF
jgi:hypothetical protein